MNTFERCVEALQLLCTPIAGANEQECEAERLRRWGFAQATLEMANSQPPRGAVSDDELVERVARAIGRSAANRPRKEGTARRFERYARAALDAMPDAARHSRGAVDPSDDDLLVERAGDGISLRVTRADGDPVRVPKGELHRYVRADHPRGAVTHNACDEAIRANHLLTIEKTREVESLRARLLAATPHDHSEATPGNPSGRCARCTMEREFAAPANGPYDD